MPIHLPSNMLKRDVLSPVNDSFPPRLGRLFDVRHALVRQEENTEYLAVRRYGCVLLHILSFWAGKHYKEVVTAAQYEDGWQGLWACEGPLVVDELPSFVFLCFLLLKATLYQGLGAFGSLGPASREMEKIIMRE